MRGLMNRRKVRDQFADRLVDLSDRFIHLDAVGTETMPGGIDNVEIEGDEDGPDFGRAPHPVEHGVDALHARHMLVEALPVRRSEERRAGKECVSTCSSRWSPYH